MAQHEHTVNLDHLPRPGATDRPMTAEDALALAHEVDRHREVTGYYSQILNALAGHCGGELRVPLRMMAGASVVPPATWYDEGERVVVIKETGGENP